MFELHLREIDYLAKEAELHFTISPSLQGLYISLEGFSDSFPAFFKEFVASWASFVPTQAAFDFSIEKLNKQYENEGQQQPYMLSGALRRRLVYSRGSYIYSDYLQALKRTTLDDFKQFLDKWLSAHRFEWLLVGNIGAETAKHIAWDFHRSFGREIKPNSRILRKDETNDLRIVRLEEGTNVYVHNLDLKTEKNSAIFAYYQVGEGSDDRSRALSELLQNFIKDKTFNQLRTNEQLGYIVFGLSYTDLLVNGVGFIIQSTTAHPKYLSERISACTELLISNAEALTDEEFQKVY
eukprot:TRINITY_DN3817_c0_g1_i6.p1 TRINITY_DN3817_c0_g1~~TRINITY_DN3817_c0_g1_i6.p1  ORF type:complete len:295 (+),score=82.99 TRINITY_DN3817_c0_g1_i6:513-1397(+)